MRKDHCRNLPVTLLVSAAILAFAGCSGRDEARDPAAARTTSEKKLDSGDEKIIAERFGGAVVQPSGLRWTVRAPGTGTATPQIGNEVIAHYDGRLLDGTSFDSSYRSGAPFVFRVGTGAVIKGWDEAFLTMKKGEKRTLIIPHWLGYGDKGSPPRIPSRATLVFEVELLDWR